MCLRLERLGEKDWWSLYKEAEQKADVLVERLKKLPEDERGLVVASLIGAAVMPCSKGEPELMLAVEAAIRHIEKK